MAVPPLIPELPQAPSRSQGQASFNLYAEPFIAAMPPMVVNINTSLAWIGQRVTVVDGYRQAAATSAQNAATSAQSAQAQVGLAADQVELATNQVGLAQTARSAAEAARDSAQNFAAAAGSAAGLPAFTGKAGKALVVNSTATGVIWGDPYPAYAGKARMSLQVLPNEQGVRWVDVGDRIGDVLVSARNPGALYLPADGAVYLKSAYTELFQLTGLLGGTKANSWSAITSGFGTNEIISEATDNNGVWLFLDNTGVLRRSANDGVTLATISLPATLGSNPAGVIYCGNNIFIIIGSNSNACFKSTDSGVTWATIPSASFPAASGGIFQSCNSDGLGNIVVGAVIGSNAYVYRSLNYGVDWALATILSSVSLPAVGIGKDGKTFVIVASGSSPTSYTVYTSSSYGAAPWTLKTGMASSSSAGGKSASVETDGLGTWVFNLVANAYRIGNNGEGSVIALQSGVLGKVATDKNGTWLVGANVSTNDAIDFSTANLSAPAPSSAAASRLGTFMVGATSGSLRRSVPTFPYDSATQFAVPNITSPVGVKAYIKAKEAA